MKICTVCGREAREDAERCLYDGAPLVAKPPGRSQIEVDVERDDEPETVVRPRKATPIPPPSFTTTPLTRDTSAPERQGAPPRGAARPGPAPASAGFAVAKRESPLWPVIAVVAVVVAGGLGALVYRFVSLQSSEAALVNARIGDARVAIADAKARVESLPVDSPLRRKIVSLDSWDRELQGFQLSRDQTAEMAERAKQIAGLAAAISEEARAAGATQAITPVVPPPVATNTNAPSTNAAEAPAEPDHSNTSANENTKPPTNANVKPPTPEPPTNAAPVPVPIPPSPTSNTNAIETPPPPAMPPPPRSENLNAP